MHVERLPGEIVIEHHLSTDEGFQGERREHVQPKAQPCDIHHRVVGREVVEYVAERLVAKGEEARKRHEHAGEHRYAGGNVGDFAETIDGRRFQ